MSTCGQCDFHVLCCTVKILVLKGSHYSRLKKHEQAVQAVIVQCWRTIQYGTVHFVVCSERVEDVL